ncbi:MAG TPA: type 2 lanthipeptide synthetase LanM family protein [Xanthobacteraceae bacterium]|nr:type 2 lanthipeptide synthetase LanM family protein [Xanthobacteraceae bacterium]
MDAFYERLAVRAATLDEVLSDDFEPLPGQKGDADLAARRLAAWCRASASGDWSLFGRRLDRDGFAFAPVLARLAAVRRTSAALPSWIEDAIWVEAALQDAGGNATPFAVSDKADPCAFEELFTPLVAQADTRLWSGLDARVGDNLNEAARASLRLALLRELSSLGTAALYERFAKARNASSPQHDAAEPARHNGSSIYDRFIAEMQAGGWRRLFEDKPVLLRLFATITRQWIETSREMVLRLDADLAAIRRDILHSANAGRVAAFEGNLSDPHNNGRSVRIVSFEDGARVVYKPKDLRLDAAWHALVERLNGAQAPIELKAVRAIAQDGYGWTEFIDHAACADAEGFARFFRRAGGWLALFHCFAATDMHQENMIACGDHPVPIDLEMILQAGAEERSAEAPEDFAFAAAAEIVSNSVTAVGLLPAYGRSPENIVFAIGGMTADWNARTEVTWDKINSDAMRPAKSNQAARTSPNLPHVDGRNAKFGDHVDDFVAGFEQYANFLLRNGRGAGRGELFDGFAGVPVRNVVRATRFYYMLLQRLRNHKAMDDGVIWSAQADFIARLSDWQSEHNPLWPLQRAERAALVELNVPHFISPSDGHDISDVNGHSVHVALPSGLDRARARFENFDEREIAWQTEVIRENTNSIPRSAKPKAAEVQKTARQETLRQDSAIAPTKATFIAEADRIAAELLQHAIRRGPSVAWIGLDWLGDSEFSQLVCLGPDLYNGICGVGVFLAAHAAVTGNNASAELAYAGLAQLRKNLKSRNAARMARALGLGGAVGLGSVVYALAVMAKCLRDDGLLADARQAAELFTDDLIAADKLLDVVSGSAGGILSLLRLYRDTRSDDVLRRAVKCGEHLLGQPRLGPEGRRTWVGQGSGPRGLNGMSHGAAGFAFALASLTQATGRQEFAQAAAECIAFENSSYDAQQHNWPDLRDVGGLSWPCQWCHGAPGIGLARIATSRLRGMDDARLDIENAVAGVMQGRLTGVDTLCCGALGGVEFFCEAGDALGRDDLRALAGERLTAVLQTAAEAGDYRWNSGKGQFNLGMFRGLAGVGYTLLRRVDGALPNVLIWE